MKINKILAAGIAATLAVTSLSAVVSAEEKKLEWNMEYTYSNISFNNERIQWLGDNDYIGSKGYGASATAKAILVDFITNDDDYDTVFLKGVTAGTHGVGKTPYDTIGDGTKPEFLTATAGKGINTAVELAAAATLTPVSTLATKAKTAMMSAISSTKALVAQNGSAENVYSAEKYLGDAKNAAAQLQTVSECLTSITAYLDTVKAADDAKAAGASTYLKARITEINKAKTAFDTKIKLAEEALIGAPLLKDTEVGGIWIGNSFVDYNGNTPVKDLANGAKMLKVTGAKLTIKGTKRGSTANESWEGSFVDCFKEYKDHQGVKDKNDGLYLAFAPRYVNRPGYINLNVFGAITDVQIQVSYDVYEKTGVDANGNVTGVKVAYYTQDEYDKDANKKITANALKKATDIRYYDKTDVADIDKFDLYAPTAAADVLVGKWVSDDNYANLDDPTTELYKMYRALYNSVTPEEFTENSGSKKTLKPFVKMTTDHEGETVVRNRAWPLAVTGDWRSYTQLNADWKYGDGNTQTYDDFGMGTQPKWFAGLASQCADFFNKQNNGQIIFKFADPAAADKWVSYGVPSTEVGLRTLQGTAMALFFNYNHSTGSIQSIGVVDKDAWTITFDIATVLDDFGGLVKGNLSDIYYGLNTGMQYGDPYNGKGYVVEKVTLKYDDAPAAVDATTDDDAAVVVADDDDDDVVADDDDDDVFADDDVVADDDDDDDDDAGIIEDDDDDDTDVNNDVDYVDGADDDANPGTGVGLAVIPAIVAAAAAIVSKKRK